jgi:hypothetical protein
VFHHDSSGKAKFSGSGGGAGRMSRGAKPTGESSQPKPMVNRNDAQAPHDGNNRKHVTETHPGTTQPHPRTGVHAFHGHHTGGGHYESETHHDGGDVEVRQHQNAEEMHDAMSASLPGENIDEREEGDLGEDYGSNLGGIGGEDHGGGGGTV